MSENVADQTDNAAAAWQPTLVGFLCNWCSYAAADLAGTSRISYASNIRITRLPCSGRVDPLMVLRAFRDGADGVLIGGCHPGDCHYLEGNFYARRKFIALRKLLELAGIDGRRFRVVWASASEGRKWAATVNKVTQDLQELGPFRYQGDDNT